MVRRAKRPGVPTLACVAAHALAVLGLLVVPSPCAAAERKPKPPDFERDIRPMLGERCVPCHGPKQQESLLRLDSRAQAL